MLHFARWKITAVALVLAAGILCSVPNFVSQETAESVPDWLPHNQLNLGLDLQGGSHLLMEVEMRAVLQQRLESLEDSIRSALRSGKVKYRNLGVTGDKVSFELRELEQKDSALSAVGDLAVTLIGNPLTGTGGGADIDVTDEGARIDVRLTEAAILDRQNKAIEQSIEIIRRRIDEFGTREPTIQRQGQDRILVQLPGVTEPERIKEILGRTARMVFRLVDVTTSPQAALSGDIPPGSELLESAERTEEDNPVEHFVVRKRVMVSGENLVDAQATFDGQTRQPVVSFRFDSLGAKKFGDATRDNVNRPFAIVLDNQVVSAPRINEPILGGSGIITGQFSVQEVQDLALLLRAGALPAPLTILEERTVGPALGADSIAAGKAAAIIAFALVMVYMVASYGIFGAAADIALIFNMFLIIGALSLFQATLTLPGIAGIVLTIGMAVDANVLVFERIREEIKSGKTAFAAMDAGYRRALGTILDANITTFLAAAILFAMGAGPVKGFAVTLGVGIITSVFTAVTVTRLFLVIWLRRTRPTALPI